MGSRVVFGIALTYAVYHDSGNLDREGFGECIDVETEEQAVRAFEVAKAYLNSVECNHDQTDRTEGSL